QRPCRGQAVRLFLEGCTFGETLISDSSPQRQAQGDSMGRSSIRTAFTPQSPDMRTLSPRQIAHHLGRTRRDFLRDAAGMALGASLMGTSPFVYGATAAKKRKVIVITFGGG